jgi:reverse gyrase
LEFILEAKCYSINNSVGVKETSRLISRIRENQFGVLITTSFVAKQAYEEVREGIRPVVILSGADVISVLKANGIYSKKLLDQWLTEISVNR